MWIQPTEREIMEAVGRLAYCNPFLAERIELERRVLGPRFKPFFPVWHPRADVEDDNPNVVLIAERARQLAEQLRERVSGGARMPAEDRDLYRDFCLYVVYYRFQQRFFELVSRSRRRGIGRVDFFEAFRDDLVRLLDLPGARLTEEPPPEHLFACCFQVRRAFHHTFRSIAGSSMPAARLRSQVWQSVFTHDARRYQRGLYRRMGDVTTLINGPSGAGKELVARAIGLSRYIPFDVATKCFREDPEASFFPLNLAALSPTLIESELFGHRRGAFTGAVGDRKGWFEVCPPLGTVFLDEIGDIAAGIQVKLLRVLETRTFQSLGSTQPLRFEGKVIAATHRDLGTEMREARFREDLYYRLCADTITAPSLRDRLADAPDELPTLLHFLAQRIVGEQEAPALAAEAEEWIDQHLGRDYAWPGNVRELSHCISNVMIHRDYRPVAKRSVTHWRDRLAQDFLEGRMSADALLNAYCTLVYGETGSYVATARRLGLDRRTVRGRIDPRLLEDILGIGG